MAVNVVGRGMLARAFGSNDLNECLFFCSGVSNSSEKNINEFEREKNLLIEKMYFHNDKCFVYFSSILSSSRSNEYYNHKFEVEEYISKNSKNYLIIRLPQVAGKVLNNTLFPFLVKSIYSGGILKIFTASKRAIVDVDDIYKGFNLIFKSGVRNKVIDFCPNYSFEPIELAQLISDYLKKDLNVEFIDYESIQECKPSKIVKEFNLFDSKYVYLSKIVSKYTPEIIELILDDSKQ
jgi:hypothetical protein